MKIVNIMLSVVCILLSGCSTKEVEEESNELSFKLPLSLGVEPPDELNPTEAYLAGFAKGIDTGIEYGSAAMGVAWSTPDRFFSYQKEWVTGANDGLEFVHNTRYPDRRIGSKLTDIRPDDADNPVNSPENLENQPDD